MDTERVETALNILCTACKEFCKSLTDIRSEITQHPSVLADQEAVKTALDKGQHVLTVTLEKYTHKEEQDLKWKYRLVDGPEPEYTETVHIRIDKEDALDNEVCKNSSMSMICSIPPSRFYNH